MSDNIKNILDDREKFSVVVAIFLLTVFAFFLLIKNDLGVFFRMDRALEETRENLSALASTVDYNNYINQFDSQFIGAGNANWLMGILTDLAGKNNVTLGSIKPVESYSVSGYRMVRVTAEGTASYPDLLTLLSGIENYNKYIYLEKLSVGEGRKSTDISGSFEMRGLMRRQMRPAEPEAISVKFTLTIASLARET